MWGYKLPSIKSLRIEVGLESRIQEESGFDPTSQTHLPALLFQVFPIP